MGRRQSPFGTTRSTSEGKAVVVPRFRDQSDLSAGEPWVQVGLTRLGGRSGGALVNGGRVGRRREDPDRPTEGRGPERDDDGGVAEAILDQVSSFLTGHPLWPVRKEFGAALNEYSTAIAASCPRSGR